MGGGLTFIFQTSILKRISYLKTKRGGKLNNPYLKSLEPIWKNPKFVFMDEERLKEVAKDFIKEDLKTPNWHNEAYPEEDNNLFIDFLGLESSINFCFNDPWTKVSFQTEYKGEVFRRAFGMAICLKRALEEGIPILDCKWLRNATLENLQYIFRGSTPMPLLSERLKIFHEVGDALERKYDGHFYNIFQEAQFRAFTADRKGIIDRLIRDFPSFWDTSWYALDVDHLLEFHKRAQLYAIMYQGRAMDSDGKLPLIVDADDLGPPADYRVPQVLKKLGILKYKPSLTRRINAQKIIQKDSLEEQEIRAQMIYAMVRLCNLTGTWIGPIDFRIWYAGTKMTDGKPHHLTPTTAY